MKILKIVSPGYQSSEYRTGERAYMPNEFVKNIYYKDGNFTVTFSDSGDWFVTFPSSMCVYTEFSETHSNKDAFQPKVK